MFAPPSRPGSTAHTDIHPHQHMANQVNRRLLVLLSRVFGIPDNFLWNKVSARGSAGESLPGTSYHRHMVYHGWDPKDYEESSLIMHGHTDFGTLTLLPSQPVSCLQMLSADGKWRWVKYEPGRLCVNLGDDLEVISGGQFKATRHKGEYLLSWHRRVVAILILAASHQAAAGSDARQPHRSHPLQSRAS